MAESEMVERGLDPVSGLNRRAQEAAWDAASKALLKHAPEMGPLQRTAIMLLVSQAAITAYVAALGQEGTEG